MWLSQAESYQKESKKVCDVAYQKKSKKVCGVAEAGGIGLSRT